MKNNEALKLIMQKLKNGFIFGHFIEWTDTGLYGQPKKHKIFSYNLYVNKYDPYIFWHYYGSSANKKTLKNLNWIVRNIFKCTPIDFIKKYQAFTQEQINNMKDLT